MLLCYAISEFDASHSTVGKQTIAATTTQPSRHSKVQSAS